MPAPVVDVSVDHTKLQAHIAFETVSVLHEKKDASGLVTEITYRDEDQVTITQPGTKGDNFKASVPRWLAQNKIEVKAERLHPELEQKYRRAYEAWKANQEVPVEGTPIKHWPLVTPAQRDTLLYHHVRSVEELANLNDEGIRHLGMGAIGLKQKAKAWLMEATDKGPLAVENAKLHHEVTALTGTVNGLMEQLKEMRELVQKTQTPSVPSTDITADDLLEDKPKRGRPRTS